jgi:hypothetical protein
MRPTIKPPDVAAIGELQSHQITWGSPYQLMRAFRDHVICSAAAPHHTLSILDMASGMNAIALAVVYPKEP